MRDMSLPEPSASGIANRPLPRDAGGRLAAQSNPSGTSMSGPVKSKDNIPKATEEAIHASPYSFSTARRSDSFTGFSRTRDMTLLLLD